VLQKMGELPLNINIQEPRWDQSTFLGRARHFFTVTDPRNLLLSGAQLEASRNIVQNYSPHSLSLSAGITDKKIRFLFCHRSFFYSEIGDQVYALGGPLFFKGRGWGDTGAWEAFLCNEATFPRLMGKNHMLDCSPPLLCPGFSTHRQLGTAYVSATTGAVATALGLKSLTKHLPPLIGRFVPFAAVAAANCINIPLMRQRELQVGIPVTDEASQKLGQSATAANQSLLPLYLPFPPCPALPSAIPPVIMNTLEKKDFLKRRPWLGAPLQVGLVGFCLVFATPLCCALFPQRSSIHVSRLEPELRAQIRQQNPSIEVVYYNKGL
uniref:Sideroflexin-3 n=1 Tax=Myotis lucifugus TaxID=59463 RepID=G1QBH5_MYOLU